MIWVLLAISGPYKGCVFPFRREPTTVGRGAENDLMLPDELASRRHFAYWLNDDVPYLRDLDTRNGTFIDGRAEIEKDLDEGNRIQCGSTNFLCVKAENVPEDLSGIMNAEAERSSRLETLRADYSVREEMAVHYRAVTKVFEEMADAMSSIRDMEELQARFLQLVFEIIPARRGAVLLNGKHVRPDRSDFISQIYREPGCDDETPFAPNGRVLDEVYATRNPKVVNTITATLCVPLFVSGMMRGVLYMEGPNNASPFAAEHGQYLRFTSNLLGAALGVTRDVESVRKERDVLRAERDTNYLLIGESQAIKKVRAIAEVAAQKSPISRPTLWPS